MGPGVVGAPSGASPFRAPLPEIVFTQSIGRDQCVTCGAPASGATGGVACAAGHFHCECIRQRSGRLVCPVHGCTAPYPLPLLARLMPDFTGSWPASGARLVEVPRESFEWAFVEQVQHIIYYIITYLIVYL